MPRLSDYEPIVGASVIEELKAVSERLYGKSIQNINSTAVGGGVAEILNRMIPLLKELDVDAKWNVIKGGGKFFNVTKKFHNALHGKKEEISKDDFSVFLEATDKNLSEMSFYGDIIFVHDPQPVALIKKKDELKSKWIWRCHIDLSSPDEAVWNFLKPFVERYDASVFTAPSFAQELKIRRFLIPPSIDPLSDKNKELPEKTINGLLQKLGIENGKPIIAQVSRFDYLKDPLGVIEVYRLVKRRIDCQLVLAGGEAADDPQGLKVLAEVKEKAKGDGDIHIAVNLSDEEINAIQRGSDVILQKSIREGFGLTVTESMWKGKPVIASAVGGIPLQIKHNLNGLLAHTVEGAALFARQLLSNPEYAQRLGQNAKEHVRQNFLLTRHLKDYLLLFLSLERPEDVVYL